MNWNKGWMTHDYLRHGGYTCLDHVTKVWDEDGSDQCIERIDCCHFSTYNVAGLL